MFKLISTTALAAAGITVTLFGGPANAEVSAKQAAVPTHPCYTAPGYMPPVGCGGGYDYPGWHNGWGRDRWDGWRNGWGYGRWGGWGHGWDRDRWDRRWYR